MDLLENCVPDGQVRQLMQDENFSPVEIDQFLKKMHKKLKNLKKNPPRTEDMMIQFHSFSEREVTLQRRLFFCPSRRRFW